MNDCKNCTRCLFIPQYDELRCVVYKRTIRDRDRILAYYCDKYIFDAQAPYIPTNGLNLKEGYDYGHG